MRHAVAEAVVPAVGRTAGTVPLRMETQPSAFLLSLRLVMYPHGEIHHFASRRRARSWAQGLTWWLRIPPRRALGVQLVGLILGLSILVLATKYLGWVGTAAFCDPLFERCCQKLWSSLSEAAPPFEFIWTQGVLVNFLWRSWSIKIGYFLPRSSVACLYEAGPLELHRDTGGARVFFPEPSRGKICPLWIGFV